MPWPTHADAWIALARNVAPARLLGQLNSYPLLEPYRAGLIPGAVEAATRWARRRRRFYGYFTDYEQFWPAFCDRTFAACLRRMMTLDAIVACLAALPFEQRQLLNWLYVDQWSYHQVAANLPSNTAAVRQLSEQALDRFRARIAIRLGGEEFDSFPVFPAGVGYPL